MPDANSRDALHKHMEAQLVMTEKFDADDLIAQGDNHIRIAVNTNYTSHMKAHLTELRAVVDEHMKVWEKRRFALADRLLADDAVVRVPYDSHHKRKTK